jgi:hypothetical protein
MEEYKQESMLTPDGTKPDSSVVSRNLQAETDVLLNTPEQKARALDIIRSGKAKTVSEAKKIMWDEDATNPVNDAWANKK